MILRYVIGGIIGMCFGLAAFVFYAPEPEIKMVLVPQPPAPVVCHTFHVALSGELEGVIYMGQIELCGENMEWSTIWGPIGSERPEPKVEMKPGILQ